MNGRLIATALVAMTLTFAVPTAASAVSDPPYPGHTDSNTSAAGGIVKYTTDFNPPAGTADANFDEIGGAVPPPADNITPVVSKKFTTSGNARLSFNVRIPNSASVGSQYSVYASWAKGQSTVVTITVVGAAADNQIAYTGVDAMPYIWFGGGLVVLGAAFVVVVGITRRNKRSAQA